MLRLAHRQTVTVDLHGELDLSRGEEIATRISEACAKADAERVAVDLADVTFLDCYTIGVLVRGQRVAAALGIRMYVVNAANPAVRLVLDLTGPAVDRRPPTTEAWLGGAIWWRQRRAAA